jgi:predicted urease superfamily metal-dependent hydrolase
LYQTLTELLGGTDTIDDPEDPDKTLAINDVIRVCKILLHELNANQMRYKA